MEEQRIKFSLNDTIRAVLNETNLNDPHEVAEEAFARIVAAGDEDEALLQALVVFVRTQVSRGRGAYLSRSEAGTGIHPQHPAADRSDARVYTDAEGRRYASAKVMKYSERAFSGQLRVRMAVGEMQHKMLGECTISDIETIVTERRAHAKRVLERADWFDNLLAYMLRKRVMRVDQLSDDELKEIFEPVGDAQADDMRTADND